KLIVPAFSIGRTQEILIALEYLDQRGELPKNLKVYVDSPLSTKGTEIFKDYPDAFNNWMQGYMKKDPKPFDFPNLRFIQHVEESKLLNELKEPCIIISASGMMDAGRIRHHVANNIENPNNTILIIGYCEP